MANGRPGKAKVAVAEDEPGRGRWGVWLAWAWVGLVVLSALAVLLDLDNLRLALDFQRHLR